MDKRDLMASPSKDLLAQAPLRVSYFRSEHESSLTASSTTPSPLPPRLALETKLNFQYRGDIFGQHGSYTDANLYMSRLPSSRKGSILRPKPGGAAYKMHGLKLEPMQKFHQQQQQQQQRGSDTGGSQPTGEKTSTSSKPSKTSRKRQYALAVEAMASNALLRASLLNDNVIPSMLSLLRTKDATTLASCVSTICHLSSDPLGREAILKNSGALALLTSLGSASLPPSSSDSNKQSLLHNYLAMLANLTIEDSYESVFVKEKALESIMKHRKCSQLTERMCTFTILNLSCPPYSYPRVDEVIKAINDCGRETAAINHRESLSRALYNLSSTRLNQTKLVDGEAVSTLRNLLARRRDLEPDAKTKAMRLNALMALWHLAENPLCRRALTRSDCIRTLVEQLHSLTGVDDHLKCTLMTLVSLTPDMVARERLGKADALASLAAIVTQLQDDHGSHGAPQGDHAAVVAVMYRLMALILSAPATIASVQPSFLAFLLSFRHDDDQQASCSRYILFSLACILWWNDNDDQAQQQTPSATSDAASAAAGSNRIDDLLDDPALLDPIFTHVEAASTAQDSPEVYLQVLLLYNLSFRYNKVDVSRRAVLRLKSLIETSSSAPILHIVCGTLFCLCQEYETHRVLHASGVLATLPLLIARCDQQHHDTQSMCLEVVCVIFDGRMLPRSDLVDFMGHVAPALVDLCESGSTTLRADCAACFARFASIEECRPAMAHHGVTRALAILANEEDTQTLRLCVYAYSYLSRDAVICAQLIHGGIIKSLTFLAAAPEEAVRRACAMTLCNLSTAEENIGALAKAGALKALLVISCVKSNDPETRRICMKAVMNLLRLPANVPLLCQDGLLWAFGLFTSGMEAKDYDILCDAFLALAFYPATRKGVVKPAILSAMFQVFDASSASTSTKVKLLKGLSNVLCDLPNAAQLIHTGVLPHLVAVVDQSPTVGPLDATEGEARMLVAQILVLIFQSCPDAESEFAEPAVLRVIERLLRTDHDDCGRCCAILLYQMSLHAKTRASLVQSSGEENDDDGGRGCGVSNRRGSLLATLPHLFVKSTRETQALLVQLLYNVSCDARLNRMLDAAEIVQCILTTIPKKIAALSLDVATLCAGLLRNLSCEASSHSALMDEHATSLLKKLFDVDDAVCKEDAAVCLSNLFMGRINSNALLSRSVLPMVLRLCSHTAAPESRALGTTVVRKLALAPGNTQALVDGGVISHMALLMQESVSLSAKKNCVATFCCISRKTGVPAVLASYGVIANALELLQTEGASDSLFEAMCVDLLSALAEFARADDPVESKLASTLFHLVENNNDDGSPPSSGTSSSASAGSSCAWQSDRTFLSYGAHSGLSPPTLSTAHHHVAAKAPMLRHILYPIRFAGYSVDFTQMANHIELRTIEPIFPSLSIIGESAGDLELADGSGGAGAVPIINTVGAPAPGTSSSSPSSARLGFVSLSPPSRFDFAPLPMFAKLLTPFAPSLSIFQQQQHQH